MMERVFLTLLRMSLTASVLVAVVILLRVCLKRAPKWINGLLWAFVALRLLLPISVPSVTSVLPEQQPIRLPAVSQTQQPLPPQTVSPEPTEAPSVSIPSATPKQPSAAERALSIASVVWPIGMAAMAGYALIAYARVRKRVKTALPVGKRIYSGEHVQTPFILGIFSPRIYLPSGLSEEDTVYVLAHEQAHLHRLDHLWKPFGFALLCVYWFNPVLWVAYLLLCRDIELACDERVIRLLGEQKKKGYANALLTCSIPRKTIAACPVAFGEVDVKERVTHVLQYKKPAVWILILSLLACAVVAACLLTDPIHTAAEGIEPSGEEQTEQSSAEEATPVFDEIDALYKQFSANGLQVAPLPASHAIEQEAQGGAGIYRFSLAKALLEAQSEETFTVFVVTDGLESYFHEEEIRLLREEQNMEALRTAFATILPDVDLAYYLERTEQEDPGALRYGWKGSCRAVMAPMKEDGVLERNDPKWGQIYELYEELYDENQQSLQLTSHDMLSTLLNETELAKTGKTLRQLIEERNGGYDDTYGFYLPMTVSEIRSMEAYAWMTPYPGGRVWLVPDAWEK